MARLWPALDVWNVEPDLLLALLDDYQPTALEERESAVRLFFPTSAARDGAAQALAASPGLAAPRHESLDVSDEDWARRSQENLQPITVGRITVLPDSRFLAQTSSSIAIVIPPSMAFGTGHHVTTRLCLAALQTIDLTDAIVLDVGTGSGILGIAAVALGAAHARGIDSDPDAIEAAAENLSLNQHIGRIAGVSLECVDIRAMAGGSADVVVANLTGALVASEAATLVRTLRPEGRLILSGVLADEWDAVIRSFEDAMKKVWQSQQDGWIGAVLVKR